MVRLVSCRARLLSGAVLLLLMSANVRVTAQPQTAMCVIDMGSNSFRRIVGTFADGRYSQLRIEVRTLGVGDDAARHGRISDAKMAEIVSTLSAFRSACEKDRASPIRAVGTAAFRQAANGQDLVAAAKKLGIAMEIASERRESELAYLVGSLGQDGHAVIDNGSRSIELVSKDRGELRHHVANLGYRVAYETFFERTADPAAAVGAFQEQLRQHAAKAPFMKGMRRLVGVEFGEMADGLFDKAPVEGRTFPLATLKARLAKITGGSADAFQALKTTKDIDRSLPRLVVAVTVMEAFGYTELALTERELGAGLIIEAGGK
jgi:Ppx/GppA phosphatase family